MIFIHQALHHPCFGDPAYTFSDVERAVQRRLHATGVIAVLRMREADTARKHELATLARLQAKYGAASPPPAGPTHAQGDPAGQDELFADVAPLPAAARP